MTHGVNKYIYVKHKHQEKYVQLRLINELKQKMRTSELRQLGKSYNSGWWGGGGEIRQGWNEIKSIHITHQAEFQENVSLHQQNQS